MTNPTPPGQVPDALIYAELPEHAATGLGQEYESFDQNGKPMGKAYQNLVYYTGGQMRAFADATHALRAQQDDAYDHGPQAETVEEAARDVGKWLNERPNRPLDLRHVAMLTHHAKRTQQPAPVAAYEVADALADSQYLAGVSAGWNAANADDPNAALQKLHESRAGYLKPLSAARAPAESVGRDAERLDFLIEQSAYVVSDPDACPGYWLNFIHKETGKRWVQCDEHPTPRAAIDSAMAANGGNK